MLSPSPSTAADVTPAARIADRAPYVSPQSPHPVDLWLNNNEGLAAPPPLLEDLGESIPELVRRYPRISDLEALIAERTGLPHERVLVTAGADDAIYRACMAVLERGRELILPTPTFEMIERYARLVGGTTIEVDWLSGSYPVAAVIDACTDHTAMIAVVSPNNPTGAAARVEDLRLLSAAAPRTLLLVDLAYTEFADEDLTQAACQLPNALITRTLSKAWGLAGLRVGYALGPPNVIRWLRSAGNPYPVSSLSAALAVRRLRTGDDWLRDFASRVRAERRELTTVLRAVGAEPLPSQANFVLAQFADARRIWVDLARRGIAVRSFPGHPQLENYLRITCPGEPTLFDRLLNALREIGNRTS